MTDAPAHWAEEDSRHFIDTADVFVPMRAEQIATIRDLLPADPDDAFTVAELASGDGTLARAILAAFPNCHYVALDGSEVMREQARQSLAAYGDRLETRDFELADRDWRAALPRPLRCVVSSLTIHHLPGAAKRDLFADLRAQLEPGGALIIADIMAPSTPRANAVFARQWDDAARAQSLETLGDLSGYEEFTRSEWNFYHYGQDDPIDKPSGLYEQLEWLRDAGFTTVDCFWMRAGHAIYGGYV
jgi:SAM-dependent methyltransferase